MRAPRPRTAVLALLIAFIASEASAQSCSPGSQPSLTGTSCVKCSGNTVSPGGTAPCTSCGTRATANSAKTACACNTGFAGTPPACATCVAGYGGSSCSKCSGNTYSPGGTANCTSCGASATASSGNTACTCKAGFTGTAPECASCLAGYGGTSCSKCTANDHSTGGPAASTTCQTCGTRATATSNNTACACNAGATGTAPACETCKAGYGGSSCTKCTGNTYSFGGPSSSTTCATCGTRATAVNNNTACACNEGANGTAPACNTCKAGYGGPTCSKCTANDYSAGGPAANTTCQTCGTRATATSNNTACKCLTGFTGTAPSCLSCIPGYGGPTCTKCTGNLVSGGGPSSSTSCVLCGIRATAVNNNTACACNEGANGTAPACNTCKAGYGGIGCTKCTGNTYSSGGPSSSTTCATCGTRATAVNNNTACACNEGANGTAPACSTCMAGFAGSNCTKCTGNTYSPGGPTTTTCLSCGTRATAINNNTACQCIAGSNGTAPACTCLPGYGGTTCAKCTGNTFSANGTSCQTCAMGTTANSNNTACVCANANQEVYKNACVDKCPAAAPRNAQGVCTCTVAGQVFRNGTCVCTNPSLVATSNGCVAACPSGQAYNAAGVCACTNTTLELVNGACVLPDDNTLWQRDYAALISGIAPTDDLAFGDMGPPGEIALYGKAFPVILSSQNKTAMAAGRTGSGRVVVFNKEGYMESNTDAAKMGTAIGKLLANAVRWVGGGGTTIRVAGPSMDNLFVQPAGIENLQAAATKQGFTITYPDGHGTDEDPCTLGYTSDLFATNGSRTTDVFMAPASFEWSDEEIQDVVKFIKAGGGFLTGGQAWYHSYTKPITDFRSNVLLKTLNSIQWTAGDPGGETIYYVSASAPGPLSNFNADVAGAALAKHYSGAQILDANSLNILTHNVADAVRLTPNLDDTPTTFASAGTWRSFNGTVAKAMFNLAKTWDCTQIDSSEGESHLAAAYIGKANQELGPDKMAPAACSLNFPSLGVALSPDATPITVTIKANYPDQTQQLPFKRDYTWLSTGIYAVAGAPLTITLPASVAGQLNSSEVIGVQIGSHTDSISHKETWCRLPQDNVKWAWFTAANSGTMRIASNQGGLVYILIKRLVMFGDIDVTLAGGVRAPFFLKGRHTNEQWVSTIRNYPAPWAEIGNDRFVMTVPSSDVRAITDPQKVADMYDLMMDGAADLAVYPRDRPNNERLVLDCDIYLGWMHSGYPVMGYISLAPQILTFNVGDPEEFDDKWGVFHELGHNHQIPEMTVRYTGEVTCNLWSVYLMETVMKLNRTLRNPTRRADALNYFQSRTYSATGYDTTNALTMYLQLQENFVPGNITAGWDVMKAILRKYQDLIDQIDDEDERVQRWVVETSTASGQNLIPYFEQWKWPVTDATRATIAGLGLSPIKFDPKDPCASGSLNACSPSECCANDYT